MFGSRRRCVVLLALALASCTGQVAGNARLGGGDTSSTSDDSGDGAADVDGGPTGDAGGDGASATDDEPATDLSLLNAIADAMPASQHWLAVDATTCTAAGVTCAGPFTLQAAGGSASHLATWCGGAWDGGRMFFQCFGHATYANDNSIMAFDATRIAFTRVTDPSAYVDDAQCEIVSGPNGVHTYDSLIYVPRTREIWSAGAFTDYGRCPTLSKSNTWGFASGAWTELLTVPVWGWGGSAILPSGNVVMITGSSSGSQTMHVYDPTTRAAVQRDIGAMTGFGPVAEVSGERLWIAIADTGVSRMVAVSVNGGGLPDPATMVVKDFPTSAFVDAYASEGAGLAPGPDGSIIRWDGRRATYRFDVVAGDIVMTTFSNTDGPAPNEPGSGPLGRFIALGGGLYLGVGDSYTEPAWLYRL